MEGEANKFQKKEELGVLSIAELEERRIRLNDELKGSIDSVGAILDRLNSAKKDLEIAYQLRRDLNIQLESIEDELSKRG